MVLETYVPCLSYQQSKTVTLLLYKVRLVFSHGHTFVLQRLFMEELGPVLIIYLVNWGGSDVAVC